MSNKEKFLFDTELILSNAGVFRLNRIRLRFQLIRIMAG